MNAEATNFLRTKTPFCRCCHVESCSYSCRQANAGGFGFKRDLGQIRSGAQHDRVYRPTDGSLGSRGQTIAARIAWFAQANFAIEYAPRSQGSHCREPLVHERPCQVSLPSQELRFLRKFCCQIPASQNPCPQGLYGTALWTTQSARARPPSPECYLIATFAASSSFLSFSASSLEMPSLTLLGTPSTRSLASFRPRPVAARTTLMTPIF